MSYKIIKYTNILNINYYTLTTNIHYYCKLIDKYITKHTSVTVILIIKDLTNLIIRELIKRNIKLIILTNVNPTVPNTLSISLNIYNIKSILFILKQLVFINYIVNINNKPNSLLRLYHIKNKNIIYYLLIHHKSNTFISKHYLNNSINNIINDAIIKNKNGVITKLTKLTNFYRQSLTLKKFAFFRESNIINLDFSNYTHLQSFSIFKGLKGDLEMMLNILHCCKYNLIKLSLNHYNIYKQLTYNTYLGYRSTLIYKIKYLNN